MRMSLVSSLALAPLLSACQGAMWGNLAIFVITVGIFMGTLTLGRGR